MDSEIITVGYFAIRVYVDHIKLLLEYKDIPYVFESYTKTQLPDGSWLGGKWYEEAKYNLGLDFPNAPYYIETCEDGSQFKLTESMAILRHLGRKHSLYGNGSLKQSAVIDMVVDVAQEMRTDFANLTYSESFDQLKDSYLVTVKTKLGYFEKFMDSHGKDWVIGEDLTIADFILWPVLDFHELLYPEILDGFRALKAFKTRLESLPRIAEYLRSDRFSRFPINNPRARWGTQKET